MTADRKCPYCGTVNRAFCLDETGGCMECIRCKRLIRDLSPTQKHVVKVHRTKTE